MTRSPTKQPSQRQLQMGEEMRHALTLVLQRGGLNDPMLMDGGRITVSEVSVSPDLKNAKAYVMTLGGKEIAETLKSLNAFAPQLRHELSQRIHIKFMPKLTFVEDTTFANAEHIDALLRRANIPHE